MKIITENHYRILMMIFVCIIFIIECVSFMFIISFPPFKSIKTLPISILPQDYQNNYEGELALVSSSQAIEGSAFLIKFYNLHLNKTYYIAMASVGWIKEFNGTEEINIWMRAEQDNWCYLGHNFRDLIWIWVGEIEK